MCCIRLKIRRMEDLYFLDHFSPVILQRAESYSSADHITILSHTTVKILATVRGTEEIENYYPLITDKLA